MNNSKIKIFVSMHDDFFIPNNNLMVPIQVGSAISEMRFAGMLHDDEGDNISEKNKMYCELTAQYWAWKNLKDLDYYGFFHYRRYMSFNPVQLEHWENIVYFDYCDENAIASLMLNETNMRNLIECYDVIYPQANPIGGDSIYEHWCKHLEKKDLDIMIQVIMEKYPEFYEITKDVINAKDAIHCNMFIMKKEYFIQYSEWLFDILSECEKRIDFSNYSTEKLRTLGHMAERLCAIYGKYLEKKNAKICYVQRCLFRNTEKVQKVSIQDKKNQIPIILSCDNKYVKYTSVLIESITKNSSSNNNYCIFILNKDITDENKAIIYEQVATMNNISVDFIDVKRVMNAYGTLFVDRHLSIETYYRFLALEIFPNLSKILYLDCDVIVNRDVAELFNTDIKNYSVGAVRDADIISLYPIECDTDPDVRNNIDTNICLKDYKEYFQAGVLLLNMKRIRKKYKSEDLFDVAAGRRWKFQDQDILNYLFRDDVYYLDMKWNSLYECFNRAERIEQFAPANIAKEYRNAKENPWIIHYAGTPKPWEKMQIDLGSYFWKYAKTSPFFEILIHEMNIHDFQSLKTEYANLKGNASEFEQQGNDLQSRVMELEKQRNDLQYYLDETRKSFSYRLAMIITFIPRKMRKILRRE